MPRERDRERDRKRGAEKEGRENLEVVDLKALL